MHYHGPGGLNGRVRDGNGCGPASMVAGEAAGGGAPAVWAAGEAAGGVVRPRRSRGSVRADAERVVLESSAVVRGTPRLAGAALPFLSPARPPWRAQVGHRVGVVKPLGCWNWSAAAVARRTL